MLKQPKVASSFRTTYHAASFSPKANAVRGALRGGAEIEQGIAAAAITFF